MTNDAARLGEVVEADTAGFTAQFDRLYAALNGLNHLLLRHPGKADGPVIS